MKLVREGQGSFFNHLLRADRIPSRSYYSISDQEAFFAVDSFFVFASKIEINMRFLWVRLWCFISCSTRSNSSLINLLCIISNTFYFVMVLQLNKMVVKSLSVHQNSINCFRARHHLKLQWEIKIIVFQAFEKYFFNRLNEEKLRDKDWNSNFAANLCTFFEWIKIRLSTGLIEWHFAKAK